MAGDGARLFGAALTVAVAGAAGATAYLETRSDAERAELTRRASDLRRSTVEWIRRQSASAMELAEPVRAAAESALLSEVIHPGQVAAAWRALEPPGDAALVCDPLAEVLAGKWAMRKVSSSLTGPHAAAARREGDLILIRTRYFDDFLLGAVVDPPTELHPAATDGEPSAPTTPEKSSPTHIRQVLLVGAGCDSRAYRCSLPRGTVVYELDSESASARKADALARARARPSKGVSVVRVPSELDLHLAGERRKPTWVSKLLSAGFDPHSPSVWVLEGAFSQASEAQVHFFMKRAAELSSIGSKWCCSVPLPASTKIDSSNSDMGSVTGAQVRRDDPSVAGADSHRLSRRSFQRKRSTGAWTGDHPDTLSQRLGMQCIDSTRAGSEKANFGRWPGRRVGSSVYLTFQKPPAVADHGVPHQVAAQKMEEAKREMVQQFLSESVTPEAPLSEVTAADDSVSQQHLPSSDQGQSASLSEKNQSAHSRQLSFRETPPCSDASANFGPDADRCNSLEASNAPSETEQETKLNVELVINEDVLRGASIRMCGNIEDLGSWDPMEAPVVVPNSERGTELTLSAPSKLEYKFVILDSEEAIRWEKGANRHLNARPGATHVRHVWRVV